MYKATVHFPRNTLCATFFNIVALACAWKNGFYFVIRKLQIDTRKWTRTSLHWDTRVQIVMKQYHIYTSDSVKGNHLTNNKNEDSYTSLDDFNEMAEYLINRDNPEYISIFSISKTNHITIYFERYRDKDHSVDLRYKNKYLI